MKKFQCTECEEVSTALEWNIQTARVYGEGNDPIEDVETRGGCWFTCPKCEKRNDGEDLEELEVDEEED